MAYTSLLFINDVKPLFFAPHPTLPHSPRREERRWGSGGIKSLLEKDTKKKNQSFPLTLLSSEEESLSPPGRFGSESVHIHSHPLLCTARSRSHTHLRSHTDLHALKLMHTTARRDGSQARAHCRLPLAWESLMRSSLRAEAHTAISKALCCGRFIPGSVAEC